MTTTTVEDTSGKPEKVLTDDQWKAVAEVATTEEKPAGAPTGDEKPNEDDQAGQSEEDKPEIDWRAMARKHEDRWKALSAENSELKKQLETASDAAGRVGDLEANVSAAEKRAERAEIAAEVAIAKGVKLRYLTGETREELEASADEVLEDFKSMSKVGVVPTQGTGEIAPRATDVQLAKERAAKYKL